MHGGGGLPTQDKHLAAPPIGLGTGVGMGLLAFGGLFIMLTLPFRKPGLFVMLALVCLPVAMALAGEGGTITSSPLLGWAALPIAYWLNKSMTRKRK